MSCTKSTWKFWTNSNELFVIETNTRPLSVSIFVRLLLMHHFHVDANQVAMFVTILSIQTSCGNGIIPNRNEMWSVCCTNGFVSVGIWNFVVGQNVKSPSPHHRFATIEMLSAHNLLSNYTMDKKSNAEYESNVWLGNKSLCVHCRWSATQTDRHTHTHHVRYRPPAPAYSIRRKLMIKTPERNLIWDYWFRSSQHDVADNSSLCCWRWVLVTPRWKWYWIGIKYWILIAKRMHSNRLIPASDRMKTDI